MTLTFRLILHWKRLPSSKTPSETKDRRDLPLEKGRESCKNGSRHKRCPSSVFFLTHASISELVNR